MEVVNNMILIEFPEESNRFSSIHGVIIGEKSQDRKAREHKRKTRREHRA